MAILNERFVVWFLMVSLWWVGLLEGAGCSFCRDEGENHNGTSQLLAERMFQC
jgi:hypothetical protein